MFDDLRVEAKRLIKTYAAHLPDGAEFSQAQLHAATSNRVVAFWRVNGSEVWGTITEDHTGYRAGEVLICTWLEGATESVEFVARAAHVVAS